MDAYFKRIISYLSTFYFRLNIFNLIPSFNSHQFIYFITFNPIMIKCICRWKTPRGKNPKFVWSESCQKAFDNLKAILANEPVLAAPDFGKPYKLAKDASDVGVGVVLFQDDASGIEKPVSYFSKKLNKHQKAYSTIEKEALSLIFGSTAF